MKSKKQIKDKKNVKKVLQHPSLVYVSKILLPKFINHNHNEFFVKKFRIKKSHKLIARKYNLLTLWKEIKSLLKHCNICLIFKTIHYKLHKIFNSY